MSSEVFEALSLLEKERGIPVDFMLDKIKKAILTACKSSYNGNDDAIINMNPDTGVFEVYLQKTVVEEVEDKGREISLQDAREIDPNTAVGEKVGVQLDTKQFGRIAAQTARNIIRQGIRDGERGQMMQEFQSRHQELVTATVERIDPRSGAATLKIGKAEAVLPKSEQVGGEELREGDHVKVYVVDVKETEKGPRAMISRTHPDLVKRLFEEEVSEVHDGTVEIKAIAREAGSRTKIAVKSNEAGVDPVGACVGVNGARVNAIVNELRGEKIDIINWDENPAYLIENALSPAKVICVVADEEAREAQVIVPDYQLSLAIGKEGQNARLAARLTGFKIDIKSETQARESGDFMDYENDYEEDDYDDDYDYSDDELAENERLADTEQADVQAEAFDTEADENEAADSGDEQ